ncbi:MAG: hypothetical protein F4Y63_09470 [Chloroflexi bacterium]|nr:hypothetical protein [Chloroflexota bacterium]MYK60886.1 hypothetical protein [Chloroflexota bacterium]
MKSGSNAPRLRRFTAVLAVIAALIVTALTPSLVVSLVLTQDTVDQVKPTEQAKTIDVTDIDENGTVMYAVSSSYRQPGFETESLTEALRGSDLIKVTFQDSDSSSHPVNQGANEGCGLTLHLSSDDRYDAGTKTYVGYIRVEDGEPEAIISTNINCALKFVESETDYELEPVDLP